MQFFGLTFTLYLKFRAPRFKSCYGGLASLQCRHFQQCLSARVLVNHGCHVGFSKSLGAGEGVRERQARKLFHFLHLIFQAAHILFIFSFQEYRRLFAGQVGIWSFVMRDIGSRMIRQTFLKP